MINWLLSRTNLRRPKALVGEAINENSKSEQQISALAKQLSEIEQALAALTKISRRTHLSSDLNSAMLKDIQSELKTVSSRIQDGSERRYAFEEAELLAMLDQSASSALTVPETTDQETLSALQTKLGWVPIAKIQDTYHPTDCEVVEAVIDAAEPGLINHIVQQGYRTREGRLIRKAKVIITKSEDSSEPGLHTSSVN